MTASVQPATGITHLQVVSVPVSDQERSKRFYVDVLGFDVRNDNDFQPGMRWVELVPPGAATSITLVTWMDTMPPGAMKGMVLSTDDMRATYEALAARGLQWSGPVQEEFWGTFAMFDDPDGNSWVVAQSKPLP
jgi:catechol 2,3-dioxygenase-like lactoylglutathione lyase family enzyme